MYCKLKLMRFRHGVLHICCSSKHNSSSRKSNLDEDVTEFDQPIKYSTSPAAGFGGGTRKMLKLTPWYQGICISTCVAIFCIYFGIFREENDIDEKFSNSLPKDVQDYLYEVKDVEQKNRHKINIMRSSL